VAQVQRLPPWRWSLPEGRPRIRATANWRLLRPEMRCRVLRNLPAEAIPPPKTIAPRLGFRAVPKMRLSSATMGGRPRRMRPSDSPPSCDWPEVQGVLVGNTHRARRSSELWDTKPHIPSAPADQGRCRSWSRTSGAVVFNLCRVGCDGRAGGCPHPSAWLRRGAPRGFRGHS